MELLLAGVVFGVLVFLLNRKANARNKPEKDYDAVGTELKDQMEELLDRDCFFLVLQPVVDLRTGAVSCGEVLTRLDHPERGVICPDLFLPVIDALELHSRFDRYIFQKCCAWLSRAGEMDNGMGRISCNFSRKTLTEETLVPDLIRIADRYGIAPSRLAIEITEREEAKDREKLIGNLKQLKAAGFWIYLDDFGHGVTSVHDLMHYPLDIVKLDRSLLLNTHTEQGAAGFKALVGMVRQLGLGVVCEGIETETQNRIARESGCNFGQGFLFFHPKPVCTDGS